MADEGRQTTWADVAIAAVAGAVLLGVLLICTGASDGR